MDYKMGKKEELFKTVISGNLDAIKSVLAKNIDINMKNLEEQTPLMKAAYKSNPKIVEYLIKNGADVNKADLWKQTALMLSYGFNSEVVKILIEHGADVNAKNHYMRTPIMYFAEYGTVKSMKILIENGADINAVDSDNMSALLCSAFLDKDKHSENKIRLLISEGAAINQQNDDWCSPLIYAAWHLSLSTIKYFLDNGANQNVTDNDGRTALMKAILGANDDVVCFLIDKGAKFNIVDTNGETALDMALRRYNKEKILSKLKKVKALKSSEISDELKPKKIKKSRILIRSSHCPGCGSPKINLSKIPYIYCDYCAELIDWDYKIAHKLSSNVTEAEQKKYNEKNQKLEASIKKAIKNNDLKEYKKLIIKQTQNTMKVYPKMYTPRIKDENFKKKYLDFIVKTSIEYTFNKNLQKLTEEQNSWHRNIQYFEQGGRYIAESLSFRKLYAAFCKLTKASNKEFETKGFFNLYPEKITSSIWNRIRISEFIQIWIPYLTDEDKAYILKESGLKGDYHEYKSILSAVRHCGLCGNKLKVPNGAVKTLCESCGRIIDVSMPEINCPSCGTYLSIPEGKVQVQCPACNTVVVSGVKPVQPYE